MLSGRSKKQKQKKTPHQVDVVEDERGLVHLAQDQQHLVVNELLVLLQVAAHVLLQLTADLRGQRAKIVTFLWRLLDPRSERFICRSCGIGVA